MGDKTHEQRWLVLPIVGAAFALLAIGVLVWLLMQSLDGRTVPGNSRFLVVLVVAFCAGFAGAAFSGSASLKGKLKVPIVGDGPMRMAVTGGSAVFVIVLILGYAFYARDSVPEPDVNLTQAAGVVTDAAAGRIMVRAAFDPVQMPADRRLFLVVAADERCREPKAEGLVDNPLEGAMRLFLIAAKEEVRCAQLIVKDRAGLRVAASRPSVVTWP